MCKCKSEEHLGNFGDCPQCRKPVPHKHAALIKAWADGETGKLKSVCLV